MFWMDWIFEYLSFRSHVTSALSSKGHFEPHGQDASVTFALQFLTPNVPQLCAVVANVTS